MDITDKWERINVDFKTREEIALLRRVKAEAALNGVRVRQWLIELLRSQFPEQGKKK